MAPKHPKLLRSGYIVKGKQFTLTYEVENGLSGDMRITFPFSIAREKDLHPYLAVACTLVVAGMVLPKDVEVDFSVPKLRTFESLLQHLYDIRCYSEGIPFQEARLRSCSAETLTLSHLDWMHNKKHAVHFWSGGVDSTASLLLLKQNGYSVTPVHTNINVNQSLSEKRTTMILEKELHVRALDVSIEFPQLAELGMTYSKKFNAFPDFNAIPFGRDMIHLFIGCYLARKKGAGAITFGHEHELWKNILHVHGRDILRNDAQTEVFSLKLQTVLASIHPDLHLFSPIAPLSKYRIVRDLFEHHEKILLLATYCYFGKRCGNCSNCLLYQMLFGLLYGVHISTQDFESMLKTGNVVEEETFKDIIYFFYYDLIQDQKRKPGYKQKLERKFGSLLNETRTQVERRLMNIHPAQLMPKGCQLNMR